MSLLVTLDGITFSPDMEAGWFDQNEDLLGATSFDSNRSGRDVLVPKLLKFSCTMTVLHDKTIGHNSSNLWPTDGPDNISLFPNLPNGYDESQIASLQATADENRIGADFEAEERKEFDKLLEEAQDASGGDSPEVSNKQRDRQAKRANKQQKRANKQQDKIIEAKTALGMELTDSESNYQEFGPGFDF
jgi:hypothetical protein